MGYNKIQLFMLIVIMFQGWFVYSGESLQTILDKASDDKQLEAIRTLQPDTLDEKDWKTLKEQCIVNKDVYIRRQCLEKIMQLPKNKRLFMLTRYERKTNILLGSQFEKDANWELFFLSKTAQDEDGYMRVLTAFQLSGIKGVASAKLLVDILDSEFKKRFDERGVGNLLAHYWGNDEVIRQCVMSLAVLSKDEKVMDYLMKFTGSDEIKYCIEHIFFTSNPQNVRRKVLSEGIEKTSSKWLKVELINDAMETGDDFYQQVVENAIKDDFKYYAKGGIWIYPVKNTAEEALRRIKEAKQPK